MKTALILILAMALVRCQYGSDVLNEDEAIARSSSENCVFVGCSCGEDESPYFSNEAEYGGSGSSGGDQGSPYGQGHDVTCRIDENGSKDFPERDTTKQHSNIISSIELTSSGLKNIPNDRFNGLEISVADFSKNDLTSLSPDVFRGIVKLEVLDLSQNQINSLSENTFQPIAASLIQLKLNHNKLSEIDSSQLSHVLSALINLKTLILRHNELSKLPSLSDLARLEEVNLANNQLESLLSEDGRPLLPGSISDLNLENNRLKHIKSNTFSGLSNLKYLNLENNQIMQIDEQSFAHLTRLSTLNLGKNYLKHIPSHIFVTLVNLDRLDLSAQNSMLKEIEDYAFDRSSNTQIIRRIDLSKNRIAKISNKAFCSRNHSYPYVNIKDMDLGGNQLSGLNACILRQLAKGYSDFHTLKVSQSLQLGQPVSKPKLLFKQAHFATEKTNPLRCDCEVTRSLQFVDLDGECEFQPGIMHDLKNFQCSQKQENVDEDCASQIDFDCADGTDREKGDVSSQGTSHRPPTKKPDESVNQPGEVKKDKHTDGGKGGVATKSPSTSADSAAMEIRFSFSAPLLILAALISSLFISF